MLAAGGLFAFTTETHDGDGVIIGEGCATPTAQPMCAPALQAPGSNWLTLKICSARNEENVPVPGLVVVAAKA